MRSPTTVVAQGALVFVILAFLIAHALKDRFRSRGAQLLWTLPTAAADTAIRSYIEDMPISSAFEVEAAFPSGGSSSSDCSFCDQDAPKVPVRIEVCIEGLLDRSVMQSPLARRDCVMYAAAAVRRGECSPIAFSMKSADFVVSMADAPWVKILVEGADVLCFGMKAGFWQTSQKGLEKSPDNLREFVASQETSHLFKQASIAGNTKTVDFEETALLVGSTVTLAGTLSRGLGGQLCLQRWQADVSDTSCADLKGKEAPLKEPVVGTYGKETSQDPWMGKILACDDSAYLTSNIQASS